VLSASTYGISKYGSNHTLSVPLSFLVSLLYAKATKREDAVGLSYALNEMFQSSTFSSKFLHQFSFKALEIFFF